MKFIDSSLEMPLESVQYYLFIKRFDDYIVLKLNEPNSKYIQSSHKF